MVIGHLVKEHNQPPVWSKDCECHYTVYIFFFDWQRKHEGNKITWPFRGLTHLNSHTQYRCHICLSYIQSAVCLRFVKVNSMIDDSTVKTYFYCTAVNATINNSTFITLRQATAFIQLYSLLINECFLARESSDHQWCKVTNDKYSGHCIWVFFFSRVAL